MVSDKWEEAAVPFKGNELPGQLTKCLGNVSLLYSQGQLKVAVLTLL